MTHGSDADVYMEQTDKTQNQCIEYVYDVYLRLCMHYTTASICEVFIAYFLKNLMPLTARVRPRTSPYNLQFFIAFLSVVQTVRDMQSVLFLVPPRGTYQFPLFGAHETRAGSAAADVMKGLGMGVVLSSSL